MKSYDPAFGFELAFIIRDGIHRMYSLNENIFYYLTVYNENHAMPAMPETQGLEQAVIQGGYCFKRSTSNGEQIHLLSSGSIMQQALAAAEKLELMGFAVSIWSITSFTELSREAEACERWNRLHPEAEPRESHVQHLFGKESGVFVAATDYMRALPNLIAKWMPAPYVVLGTDGYGLSEARPELRRYFEVSSEYIVHASLASLYKRGEISLVRLNELTAELNIEADKADPAQR
jgi:pyruvate dehydrogenase E1 component